MSINWRGYNIVKFNEPAPRQVSLTSQRPLYHDGRAGACGRHIGQGAGYRYYIGQLRKCSHFKSLDILGIGNWKSETDPLSHHGSNQGNHAQVDHNPYCFVGVLGPRQPHWVRPCTIRCIMSVALILKQALGAGRDKSFIIVYSTKYTNSFSWQRTI